MSSHGLLNCYQHHDFQQHFSSLETFLFLYSKITTICPNATCNFKLNTQLSLNIGIKFSLNSYKKKKNATTCALPRRNESLPYESNGLRVEHPRLRATWPHLAGDNTVMLKEPLRSPVSVLKNLKAGTSKIHRNSLLPLRTFKLCKKK